MADRPILSTRGQAGPLVDERSRAIRKHCEMRLGQLKSIRSDYEQEAEQIARFAQPARSRFLSNSKDQNSGRRRQWNKTLFDPHGIEAFRTLTNGMTSGLSSASRPWFTLKTADDAMMDEPGVRDWLSEVERRMYTFFARTNFYGAVKAGYGEMGLFGTEACVMVEHWQAGAVCHPLTFGEYWIAMSDAMVPDTLYRLVAMSVKQAVDTFGDAVSRPVRAMYDRSQYDKTVEIYHAIEPDPDHMPGKIGAKPWRSVYWETGGNAGSLLKVSGYADQPFWAPRWDVVGGDTYGVSPGMEALPALRELQMQAKRRNEAIDAMVKPEKIVPPGVRLTGEPGRTVTASGVDKDGVLIPYQMPYQAVAAIGAEIDKCKQQIDGLSFADLFNAITNMRGVQPRNMEEIAARNEEKLTQLGPVIERVGNEKLEVAIDRAFGIMSRGGMLSPVPEAISGAQINVEFVSILQQMQRMVGIGQIERVVGFVGNLAAAHPEALDKIDFDEAIDEYGYRAGTPAKLIRTADQVQQIRDQRAQAQQAQQAAAMAPVAKDGAAAAELLSRTDVGGGQSLLGRMLPA
ncbi:MULTISPECIES: portal protein [unclassified Novosphingobium]|uniref:portal protein n=1 Tax=unclassified Novosphingobium TaxID=2644732 RepID=UPI000D4A0FF8|nr:MULTISPECIES: portal protein [unclassified Novosphingobium]PTR05677.1 head-to-tail connecting protein [Novosphingobium sp. GV055]PUA94245.1 head-to-tail connecting protein [Novosphingobium sp. GV061]PUB12348.1 head-to-tail connecting protein [Novosphingobium sp. GV079]PUB37262.1 head-to-tail connecting protein [Novosphingobium sp. GV027]